MKDDKNVKHPVNNLYETNQEIEVDLEDEQLNVLDMDLEWLSEGTQYTVTKAVADGTISISELRGHDKWHVVLRWLQRQLDTIKIIKTFEIGGLALPREQVKALHEAIWAEDVRPSFVANEIRKFFSYESAERMRKLDLSDWDYHLLWRLYTMINRVNLLDVPEESPEKVLIKKLKDHLKSEKLLKGEQVTIWEIQKVISEVGSLMKRIGEVSEEAA